MSDRHKGNRREYFRELHKRRQKRQYENFRDYIVQLDAEIERQRVDRYNIGQVGTGLLIAKQMFISCLKQIESEAL